MNMNNHVAEFGSIMHRTLRSVLGITMGVLILMAMAAPSARAALLTYYDFEDQNLTSDPPGLQTTTIAPNGVFGFAFDVGTNVNAVTPSTGVALVTIHSGTPDSFTLGGLTTTGLKDVNLSFALESTTGVSFTTLNLFYSTDGGVTFSANPFATVPNLTSITSYTALSFDVSTLTGGAVDNVSGSNLFFEFAFSGSSAGETPGDTFIDNIQVNAVIPEPSSYIGALFGLVGLCWFQRRRLMTRLLSLRQT
jgi:PEP-CTERM motif-containing protein